MLISAVIKAKNEAGQIRECIESLKGFASEIIVVDDRSDDDTVAIATACGAKVIHAQSKDGHIDELDCIGFRAAQAPWILRLDADERMVPTLASELTRIARSGSYTGVRYARKNIMFGEWARYGGWFRSYRLAFFKKAAWDGTSPIGIHGQVQVSGSVIALPAREEFAMVHYDYDFTRTYINRSLWKYAITDAQDRYNKGERFASFRLLYLPIRRFLITYLWRQGFRDGDRGLVLATLMAAYELCIQTNLWDLCREEKRC